MTDTGAYIDPSARPLLKDQVLNLVNSVSLFVRMEAQNQCVPVSTTTVYGHTSPEDNLRQVVITQHVDLCVSDALMYRRRLFRAIATWMKTLPISQSTIIQEKIIVNVAWVNNANTDQIHAAV